MKWFLGLLLVVALILGALFGVGFFLLPNALAVTRTVTIERPRAAVFAMINDLRIVKEWSPYYARDPDAQYAWNGEPGPGQSMRWVSDVRDVGNGRMSIVHSTENESVEGILSLQERATLNTRIDVQKRGGHQTGVSWAVTAECAEGYINVPCRYMNLILRGMVERDLDAGLARLKTLAEQLPDVDFEGLRPEQENVSPQAYVYSPVTTSNTDPAIVETALHDGLAAVNDFMVRNAIQRAGPEMRVTTEWDPTAQRMSFRVGYPFSGPLPLTVVGVQIGQTPSGPALRVIHQGPRSQMRSTYERIYAYLAAHRIERAEDGMPWEVVLNEGAENQPMQVEIFVPLK